MKPIINNAKVRLAKVYGELLQLVIEKKVTITSKKLADAVSITEANLRRDVCEYLPTGLGTQRVGYDVVKLLKAIQEVLHNVQSEDVYVVNDKLYYSATTASMTGGSVVTQKMQHTLSNEQFEEFLNKHLENL